MTTRSVLAISVLAAVLSTALLFTESEGNGELFLSRAAAQATGNTVHASSLTVMEPDAGSEAPVLGGPVLGGPVHSAQPLASGLGRGAAAYAQAASLSRFLASRGGSGPGGY